MVMIVNAFKKGCCMKRFFLIIMVVLMCVGCAKSSGDYDDVLNNGLVNGGSSMAHDHQVTDIDNSKDDKSHTINRSDISPTVDFPEGVFCPTVLDPVLGSDGRIYSNACYAVANGVTDYEKI